MSKVENGGVSARPGVFRFYAGWVRSDMSVDVVNSEAKGAEVGKKKQNGT